MGSEMCIRDRVSYVLTKVSVTVYAGAVVFETLMGIEFWSGALLIVIITG